MNWRKKIKLIRSTSTEWVSNEPKYQYHSIYPCVVATPPIVQDFPITTKEKKIIVAPYALPPAPCNRDFEITKKEHEQTSTYYNGQQVEKRETIVLVEIAQSITGPKHPTNTEDTKYSS